MTQEEPQAPDEMPAPKKPGSARNTFLSSVLFSELLIVLFATLTAHGLQPVDRGALWAVAAGLMLLCVVTASMLRRAPRPAIALGTVLQVALLASALVLPAMLLVGGIFAVLWVVSLRVGARIDAERQERHEAELAWWAERTGAGGATSGD